MSEMPIIETVGDLSALVRAGFDDWSRLGDVRATADGDLLMFSYTPPAQYAGRWNAFERMSRGLILRAGTGEVVARPFDKFFNWGEGARTTGAPIDYVMDKVDGSLIIAFHDDHRTRAATRGSFTSSQAYWAQQRLDEMPQLATIPARWTLLFEAVYPENRIVVDYHGRSDLSLLAMRDRETGDYATLDELRRTADGLGVQMPLIYDHLDSVDGIQRAIDGLSAAEEGFVAVFKDGERFKFKGAEYLVIHRAIAGLSYRRAVEAVRDGIVEDIRRVVPEELRAEFDGWVTEVEARVAEVKANIAAAMAVAPRGDRKTFALWAAEHHPELRPYLFAALDGKPLEPIIFNMAFKGE